MHKDIENEKGKDCEDGRDEDDEYTADEIALSRRLKGAKYRARQANGQIVKLPPTADAVSKDKRDEGTCQASSRKSLYSTDKINVSDTSSYCSAISELLIERQMNNQSNFAGEFVSKPSKTSEIAATPRTDRKRVWQGNGDKKSLNDPAAQVMDSSGSGCDSQIPKVQSLKTAAAGDDSLTKKARGIRKTLRRLLLLPRRIQ
ncbi:uncharacterized protein LOC107980966 [Nasonia vitripennis]|uniref:Uncharacterized protein n=1 Tax=Nasonia vitripennis TaxID=7425 RepID=A0A7M7IQI3_NASVI|nr:uncharacterized protein LOC107980966 [Nasonia vitripennis]